MPVDPQGVPFDEAIRNLRSKLRVSTQHWDDLRDGLHARAFTVAGATKADLLRDLHDAITDALAKGETIDTFRKRFDETVARHGWTYKGSQGWRTRVIYDTNMRSARAAGRWEQIQRDKERRPYLEYRHTPGQQNPREVHVSWNGTVLHVDDPWWLTHYPPNGFGCKCYTRTHNNRQLDREGKTVGPAPEIKRTRRINTTTGEDYGYVPEGIQPGFDYNPGVSAMGAERDFGRKLASLPPAVRTSALSRGNIQAWADIQSGSVARFISTADTVAASTEVAAGLIDDATLASLAIRGAQPASALIKLTAGTAVASPAITERAASLSSQISRADRILWDSQEGQLIIVLEQADDQATIARLTPAPGDTTGTPIEIVEVVDTGSLADADRYRVMPGPDN